MQTYHATTLVETRHGSPWGKQITIPAGSRVVVQDATNQPDGPKNIAYWMVGWGTRPLRSDEIAYELINGYGIGFYRGDLKVI